MRFYFTFLLLLSLLPLSAQSVFDSLRVSKTMEVFFDFGKSEIRPEGLATIDSFYILFKKTPKTVAIRVTAHTDSVGTDKANLALSQKRAEAVKEALRHKGIAENLIQSEGFGERVPSVFNNNEMGRQRNRRATMDLMFAVPMMQFSGRVVDKNTKKGIEASVFFRTKTAQDSVRTDVSGQYTVRLPKDSVVQIEAQAKGYFFESMMRKMIGTPDLVKKSKLNGDIVLAPAVAGEKMTLRNLYFVGNQAVLLKISEPELPKILNFMLKNPDLHIEIAGHINAPNRTIKQISPREQLLSEERAKLIYDYLMEHKIAASRMSYKGYGNSEMVFPNAITEADQEQNRRVEIRVKADK